MVIFQNYHNSFCRPKYFFARIIAKNYYGVNVNNFTQFKFCFINFSSNLKQELENYRDFYAHQIM